MLRYAALRVGKGLTYKKKNKFNSTTALGFTIWESAETETNLLYSLLAISFTASKTQSMPLWVCLSTPFHLSSRIYVFLNV